MFMYSCIDLRLIFHSYITFFDQTELSFQAKDNKYCSVTETESVIFWTPLWMRQKIVMILPFGR